MRQKLVLGAVACVAMLAAILGGVSAPASAQVGFYLGAGHRHSHVGVVIGAPAPPPYYYYHHRYWHRAWHDRYWMYRHSWQWRHDHPWWHPGMP